MSKISRKIQADKGMTEGVSHLKIADWSKWFVWKFIFSLTSYSVRPLWRVYVYLISSTSMQKENPVANSVRQIKIRCAKYKFAERSHNFLMQLLM